MANASNSIVPFLRDFEMDDFAIVSFKLTMNTNLGPQTVKTSLPVIPVDATHHQLFHCPHNFKQAAVIMKWTQGPKPFEAFQFVPQDPGDVDHWDGSISAEPNQRSVDKFNEHLQEFIECKFDDNTKVHRNHERFLANLKKPKTLRVQQFVTLLQCHDKIILPMPPGAPEEDASHNEEDIKHIVFNAMPITWQSKFELNSDCDESNLKAIINCMDKQDKNSKRNNPNSNNSSQSNNKENSNQRSSGSDSKSNCKPSQKRNNDNNDRLDQRNEQNR